MADSTGLRKELWNRAFVYIILAITLVRKNRYNYHSLYLILFLSVIDTDSF